MSTGRLEAFSDGVFAIVITLLVLDLRGSSEHQSIADALAHEKYTTAPYVAAFLIVGVLWINHHGVSNGSTARSLSPIWYCGCSSSRPRSPPVPPPVSGHRRAGAALFAEGLERDGFDAKVGAAVFSAMFVGIALMHSVLWLLVTRDGVLAENLDPTAARGALRGFGLGVGP